MFELLFNIQTDSYAHVININGNSTHSNIGKSSFEGLQILCLNPSKQLSLCCFSVTVVAMQLNQGTNIASAVAEFVKGDTFEVKLLLYCL